MENHRFKCYPQKFISNSNIFYSNENNSILNFSAPCRKIDETNNLIYPRNYNQSTFDTYSCFNCEEYYKSALFNNMPLRVFNCVNCKNLINEISLQFYSKKYEEEIKEEILKNLGCQINLNTSCSFKNSVIPNNITLSTDKNEILFTNSISFSEINNTFERKNINSEKKTIEKVYELINQQETIDSNNYFPNEINNEQNNHINIISNNEDSSLYSNRKEDKTEVNLTSQKEGENLAEIFKRRKTEMIQKIEERKQLKQFKSIEKIINSVKKTKKNDNKKNLETNLNKSKTINDKLKNISQKKSAIEPSPDLLNRLASGKRVSV